MLLSSLDAAHTTGIAPRVEADHLRLSEALGRIMDLSKSVPEHERSEPSPNVDWSSSSKGILTGSRNSRDGNENLFTDKKGRRDSTSEKQKEETSRKVDFGLSRSISVEVADKGEVHKKPFKYRCKLCKDRWFMERKRLYRHYSYAHFKREIVELVGKKRDQCPYCHRKFEDSQDVISHVGISHNKVEEFLQKHITNEHSLGTNPPSESLVELTCGLCTNKKMFSRRSDLYEHYSCTHFRAQLRPFIDVATDKCPLCKLVHKQSSEYKKIRHIGVVHRMVENFLPQSLHIPKNLSPLEVAQSVGRKSSERTDHQRGGGDIQLKCHLCPFKHLRRSRLYSHYATAHYRDQVLSKIGVSNLLNLQCPHCGEKRDEVDGLVRHLGSTHKMVEGFLPDELILSKSKNMKSHRAPPANEGKDLFTSILKKDTNKGEKYLESRKKSFEKVESKIKTNEKPLRVGCDQGEEGRISTPQKKIQNIRSIFGDMDDSD